MSVRDNLEAIRQYLVREDPSEPDPRDAEIARLREHINYLENWKGMTENHDPYTAAHATLRLEIDRLRSLLGEAHDALSFVTCELVGTGCEYVADKVMPIERRLKEAMQ